MIKIEMKVEVTVNEDDGVGERTQESLDDC